MGRGKEMCAMEIPQFGFVWSVGTVALVCMKRVKGQTSARSGV